MDDFFSIHDPEADPDGDTLNGVEFICYRLEHCEDIPGNILAWARRNAAVLENNNAGESERIHALNALEQMLRVRWNSRRFEPLDVTAAREALDHSLFGLSKVKQRILETMIQMNRTRTVPAYGILLAGPAGVGKSRLANLTAQLLQMPWASVDMSMISSLDALTGTPRLYMNARPGAIMQAVTNARSPDVMFLLNELDKARNTVDGGDPSMALLSLLDHLGFTDNYYECTIPTDGIYTVATANDPNLINPSVLSRFTLIELEDYSPSEKAVIFKDFVLPSVLRKLRMDPWECAVTNDAVEKNVEKYQNSTGCRALEQEAEHLASHALWLIETTGLSTVRYTADDI